MATFVSLISGSSGNATFVSDGKTNLLIDCGMSGAKLKESLHAIDVMPESIDALLITHEHVDHTKGAGGYFKTLQYSYLHYTRYSYKYGYRQYLRENIKIITEDTDFEIGNIGIRPFAIPHDAAQPVGFNFMIGDEKYSLATDIGKITKSILEKITGSKKILLESNHDVEMLKCGTYPYPLKRRILGEYGHLSNEAASKVALHLVQNGTEHIMLGHLSKENNRPEIAMLETYNLLSQSGVDVGTDMTLQVADRYKPTLF